MKFYEKGNKSAGTRVRKNMNELKRKAQEIRKEVQEIKAKTKETETTMAVGGPFHAFRTRSPWSRWDGHWGACSLFDPAPVVPGVAASVPAPMLRFRDIPEGVKRWIPPLAAAVAAVAVFLPALGFEFLEYDDLIYIFKSPLSAALSLSTVADAFLAPYFRSYSPLTLLTHAVDLRVWGERAGLHHLLNLLLHAANVVMVYLSAVRLAGAGPRPPSHASAAIAAFSAALLFAVHPLQVEPVAWISGRKDVLMTFFLLASFLAYLRWYGLPGSGSGHAELARASDDGDAEGGRQAGWPAASTALFVLALLAKSTAAAFPLVLLACDRLVLGRRDSLRSLVREKAVMFVAAGCGDDGCRARREGGTTRAICWQDSRQRFASCSRSSRRSTISGSSSGRRG